ncbi:MAG: TonB-dependent receptor, partial [Parabacteroides sp.]|nr:TonB-dependent receptor [Parabacteroides sp.]
MNGNAEAFTIVQFYKAEDNSKPIAYTTTDESGKFVQKLSEVGNYRLLLDNLGKKKKFLYFSTEGQSKIDLGTILVEDDVAALESVTVTALSKLVTIDVDRITYKVENDVEAKTKTVLDILRKVPLVSVDGMGKITVNGNTSFLVYMDGKKNQLMSENPSEIFRTMPAIMVKDIEVITDPGARYDAEGVGGVLNITSNFSAMESQKGEDMHNGNISLGGSTRKINGGAYFSAKKDKWTYSFNLNAMRSWSGETGLYSQKIQKMTNGEMKSITSGTSKSTTTNIFADMSASYEINKYNLITFSAGL